MGIGLVGRAVEQQRLLAFLAAAAGGHGQAVLVEGEPGIGKSTLIAAVAEAAGRRGIRVLAGAAEETGRGVPFAAIGSCIGLTSTSADSRLAGIAGLLGADPAGGGPTPAAAADHEFAIVERLLDLVDRWCAAEPLVLLLDDLQWADPSSVSFLHRLARVAGQLPLLLVVAARPFPRGPELDALERGWRVRTGVVLPLGPLVPDAVGELVERLTGVPAGPRLLGLAEGAAGNPLYVRELVTGLRQEGKIRIVGSHTELVEEVRVPASLSELIRRRVGLLSAPSRELVMTAAALQPRSTVTELAVLLDRKPVDLLEPLREAVIAGLVNEAGEEIVFRHDLVRQALAGELPAVMVASLHQRAGQALASAGAPVERVAEHLLAGDALTREAAGWLAGAADTLIVRAPRLGLDLLARAAATAAADDPNRETFRVKLVKALMWSGRPAEAEEVLREMLARRSGPAEGGMLHWMLAQTRFQQGQLEDAIVVADSALQLPGLPVAESARFRGFVAQCLYFLGRFPAAWAAAETAVAAGRASGDAYASTYGLYILGCVRYTQQHAAEALRYIEEAIAELGDRRIEPDRQMPLHLARATCLLELDRLAESEVAHDAALRQDEPRAGLFLTWCHLSRARLRYVDGRWDDALVELEAGLDTLDYLNVAQAAAILRTLIAIHRAERAVYSAGFAELSPDVIGKTYGYLYYWARGLMLEAGGRPEEALEAMFERWQRHQHGEPQFNLQYLLPDLARLAATVGDAERSASIADSAESLAKSLSVPNFAAAAMLCRGLASGDPEPATGAALAYRAIRRPLFEAHAEESAATLLARAGRVKEARSALGRALRLYAGLNAVWDARRAEQRLAEFGVRTHGSRQPRPTSGWVALTRTERKVAELVAQGQSNPEIAAGMFLSRRTVQTHVSHILAKLQVTSRVEIAVLVNTRNGAAPSSGG